MTNNEYTFWLNIYRAIMMIAKAIYKYKLGLEPEAEQVNRETVT